jgi:hypothetical protein
MCVLFKCVLQYLFSVQVRYSGNLGATGLKIYSPHHVLSRLCAIWLPTFQLSRDSLGFIIVHFAADHCFRLTSNYFNIKSFWELAISSRESRACLCSTAGGPQTPSRTYALESGSMTGVSDTTQLPRYLINDNPQTAYGLLLHKQGV